VAILYSFGFRYDYHDTTTVTRVDARVRVSSHEGLAVLSRRTLASYPDSDFQPWARAPGGPGFKFSNLPGGLLVIWPATDGFGPGLLATVNTRPCGPGPRACQRASALHWQLETEVHCPVTPACRRDRHKRGSPAVTHGTRRTSRPIDQTELEPAGPGVPVVGDSDEASTPRCVVPGRASGCSGPPHWLCCHPSWAQGPGRQHLRVYGFTAAGAGPPD
jgi:hypothetical protein